MVTSTISSWVGNGAIPDGSCLGVDTESSYNVVDGLMIGYTGLTLDHGPTPSYLENVNCYYNARQGFSWVGGNGLTAYSCKFNYTGKMRFHSAPGYEIDFEEGSIICDGYFYNCEFVNPHCRGMIADSGDSADVLFHSCLLCRTSDGPVYVNKPDYSFSYCTIYGTVDVDIVYGSSDPNQATQFDHCTFGDPTGLTYPCFQNTAVIMTNGQNAQFDTCNIYAYQARAFYLDNINNAEIVKNCNIYHYWNGLGNGGYQSLLRGTYIENTSFHESGLTNPYYIAVENVHVGPGVYVDGPRVKWGAHRALPA